MLQDIQYDSLLALMIIVLSPPENAPIWQRGESLTATTSRCTQASEVTICDRYANNRGHI